MALEKVTVIRYIRNYSALALTGPSNLGGITLVFNLDYIARIVQVQFSICRNDENFNKKIGIQTAMASGLQRELNLDKFQKLADMKGGFADAYKSLLEIQSVIGEVSDKEKVLLRNWPHT